MLLRCEVEGGQDCGGRILSGFWRGHQEFRSSGVQNDEGKVSFVDYILRENLALSETDG
jgi:hypothetical protein